MTDTQTRIEDLLAKLGKGHQKTREYFERLGQEDWHSLLSSNPSWNARDLLAHYVSAEEHLLELAQSAASNGPGAPDGFDIDRFNAQEQDRLKGRPKQELLTAFESAHQATIAWAKTLTDQQLDRRGRHPVLGDISVEEMLTAIYSHQILHMRDLIRHKREVNQ